MKPVIEIHQLGKKYQIEARERYLSLRETISHKLSIKKVRKDFWALNDVNLSITQGQRVGIIGGNGAGKSTLLKILSRITMPTTGQAIIRGKKSQAYLKLAQAFIRNLQAEKIFT